MVHLPKQYGDLKSKSLRCLYFQEEGFRHIEHGIHVGKFRKVNRNVPRRIVTQGVTSSITGNRLLATNASPQNMLFAIAINKELDLQLYSTWLHLAGEAILTHPLPTTTEAIDSTEPTPSFEDTHLAENTSDNSPLTQSFPSVTASTPDLSTASASRDLFECPQQLRETSPPPRPQAKGTNERLNASLIATNTRQPLPSVDFSKH